MPCGADSSTSSSDSTSSSTSPSVRRFSSSCTTSGMKLVMSTWLVISHESLGMNFRRESRSCSIRNIPVVRPFKYDWVTPSRPARSGCVVGVRTSPPDIVAPIRTESSSLLSDTLDSSEVFQYSVYVKFFRNLTIWITSGRGREPLPRLLSSLASFEKVAEGSSDEKNSSSSISFSADVYISKKKRINLQSSFHACELRLAASPGLPICSVSVLSSGFNSDRTFRWLCAMILKISV